MRDRASSYPSRILEQLSLDRQLRYSRGAVQQAIDAFLEDSCAERLVTLLAESRRLQVMLERFLEWGPPEVPVPDQPEQPPAQG
jgi:hypothetical protein